MFIAVFLAVIGAIIWFALHDWLNHIKLTPKKIQKVVARTHSFIVRGDWERAKKEIALLIKQEIESAEVRLLQATVLRGTGRLTEALEVVQKGNPLYPEELAFRLHEGKILLALEEYEKALQCFHIASPILQSEEDLIAYATCTLKNGEPSESLRLSQELLLTSEEPAVLMLTGQALFALQRYEEAISFYTQAIKKGALSHQLLMELALTYRRLGYRVEAESIYREVLEKDSSDIEALLGLGACMQEKGHYQKALLIYQNSKAWDKKTPQLLYEAGKCALFASKAQLAATYFTTVLQTEKPTLTLLSYFAQSLTQLERFSEAESIHRQTIDLFPDDPTPFKALAYLFGTGQAPTLSPEEALSCANRALLLQPDEEAWEILSACEARLSNFERATQIQEYLATLDTLKEQKLRRQQLLRALRKKIPLEAKLLKG